jgi:RNA polymerase sigma factor (TIGR02999 family)
MDDDPSDITVKDITALLVAWSGGDKQALEELMPRVYDHLREMAGHYLRRERQDHTLQTGGLVNEAFLRLVRQDHVDWESRSHFFAIASSMMRRILVDHAKYHGSAKRDSKETVRLAPEVFDQFPTEKPEHVIALDDPLDDSAKEYPEEAKLVELRYFGGLNREELAAALDISPATVTRRWRMIRAWLYAYLVKGDSDLL